ncbi:MAG TPA: PQQ-binding-like beta-propeller repeat protein, partial [Bacteroidia bacterium]|nr:PQQ-binding-like beta-propeller repeat protein [Bacteroidia bacterium]
CILVEVEKQYISGKGGIFKLNPRLDVEHCVEWFFPTGDLHFSGWEGGVIGSVALNDSYNDGTYLHLAAFTGIDGNLDVVQYDKLKSGATVSGPDGKTNYPTPVLQFTYHIGPSISTPVFTKGKLVAAGYQGINLFSFDRAGNFELQKTVVNDFEASPVADDGRVYIASRDGYLYCFGDTNKCLTTSVAANTTPSEVPQNISVAPVEKKETVHVPVANKSFAAQSIPLGKKNIAEHPKEVVAVVAEKPKPVEVKVIPPSPHPSITKSPSKGNFHLIAGVFRSKENADNFEKLWKSRGMDAQIFISPKGMYYVSIGNAANETDLSGLMGSVKEKYKMDTWIFER